MKKLRFQIKKILILSMVVINLLPFFINDVYADTWISPTYYDSSVRVQWATYGGTVENWSEDPLTAYTPSHLTFTFDNHYYGYLSFTGYYGSTSDYVSGTCFVADGQGIWNYRNPANTTKKYIDSVRIDYINLVIPDSSVDLTQIIDLLTAIETDTTSIDSTLDSTLTAIQNVLAQLIISNGYLNTLTQIKQFNIPFESLNFTIYFLYKEFDISQYYDINYTSFPLFVVPTGSDINKFYATTSGTLSEYEIIMLINANISNTNNLQNHFTVSDGSLEFVRRLDRFIIDTNTYSLIRFKINNFTSNGDKFLYVSGNKRIIPIYFHWVNYENVSTEFALQYGLSNSLLNNINIIANGTTQSNQSASNIEQSNTTLETSQNQMFNFENQQNQNMNNALNQIDTNFNIGNVFGSSFLASVDWVRTQFNLMTAGNAFGSVLSFSLLLGLSLLIIGKVLG